jgi:FAD:protein FMN transferase
MRDVKRLGMTGLLRAANGTTRRRVLGIVAAAAGVPLLIAGVKAWAPKSRMVRWDGVVLGAPASVELWHGDEAFARRTILKLRQEIERLERIFSLYRADSEVSRLNAAGVVRKPSAELRALVEQGQRLSVLSGGAFDLSVQVLWRLYEAEFRSGNAPRPDFGERARAMVENLVDYRGIDVGGSAIGFTRPGMAITPNALAQGAITDAVSDILAHAGSAQAMVDLGEYRALGRHPEGRPFRVGLERSGRQVELADRALAVSGGYGTVFEASGRYHHLFDPRTGESTNTLAEVAVLAPSAMIADGLATAICVAGEARAEALLAGFPGAQAIVKRPDGTSTILGSGGSVSA